mmetsp:Transcript_16797/g.29481  ORF Transcript_16797/g.29481 Transcript_16797/m.29481 type:complete len:436 (-) Transcript_16797:80-1387(-)|eukprot:CAMPEP_0197651976 /NCGR_PEP_ID=MMETSP1338-20131121/34169_1 /TAXON_ID=43686 ORGANISM="Pelagodinium beii, Strain RCC1491" /NCGR_SAMPLE_ID=MMETSP1338 /ASSEMBLY_ACC=CAM_ASM_000754 /LENGTH=435 /DNA_ID=CAMNT_0043226753 /DNA_START=49 /DNA_END=1356 /DNA_ORIENTATION=+
MHILSVLQVLIVFKAATGFVVPTHKSSTVTGGDVNIKGEDQRGAFRLWSAEQDGTSDPQTTWNPLSIGLAFGLIAALLTSSPAKASDWDHTDIPAWSQKYPMCAARSQSPIDISTGSVDSSKSQQTLNDFMKYNSVNGREIVHNGHVMQVNGNFGLFSLPDGDYEVKQFHFHFPAEHSVNGQLGAGEMHIVHQRKGASGTDGLAVLGIILEEQATVANGIPEIKMLSQLGFGSDLPENGSKSEVLGNVDLNAFKSEISSGFYHYEGSLTTPPCAEGVHWYVAKKAAPVTRQMINTFKERFPDPGDNRPVQPVYSRTVLLNHLDIPGEFERLVQPPPKPVAPPSMSTSDFSSEAKKKIQIRLEQLIKEIDDEAIAKKKAIDEDATSKKAALKKKTEEKIAIAEQKAKLVAEAREAARLAAARAEELSRELLDAGFD